MLALRSRGLGSVWTTLHLRNERAAAELLGIPDGVSQVALIPVAYTIGDQFKPATPAAGRDRRLVGPLGSYRRVTNRRGSESKDSCHPSCRACLPPRKAAPPSPSSAPPRGPDRRSGTEPVPSTGSNGVDSTTTLVRWPSSCRRAASGPAPTWASSAPPPGRSSPRCRRSGSRAAPLVTLPLPMRLGSIEAFVDQTRRRIVNADAALVLIDPDLAPFLPVEPGDPFTTLTLDELIAVRAARAATRGTSSPRTTPSVSRSSSSRAARPPTPRA